jgi:predicted nucleic acid-binding protein
MARRRQRSQLRTGAIPDAVVLDSSALSGAAAGQDRVRAELALAEELGVGVHVSSVTLTETLRGHRRDARVHAVLAGADQRLVTPQLGRAAGELLGQTNRNDTIDAIVAVTAESVGRRVRLLTGDPDDLAILTADMKSVSIVPI